MPSPKIRLRKDHLRKDGTGALYLQLIIDRRKLWIPLEVHVRPVDWNEDRERVRPGASRASDLNLLLDQARARCTDILIRFRLSGEELSRESFLAAWDNPSGLACFLDFWRVEMYRQFQAGHIKAGTLIYQERHLRRFGEFLETLGRDRCPFNCISVELAAKFDLWLSRKLKAAGHDGRSERWNCQKVFRKYLNAARAAGHDFTWPFPDRTKVRPPAGSRVWLEEEEVRRLWALLDGETELTQARRIVLRGFLVQCFSGLRFGDLQALAADAWRGSFLHLVPEKTRTTTGKKLRLPVSSPLRDLLEGRKIEEDRRFAHRGRAVAAGCLVPTLTEPATNRELKNLARIAGIDKNLTTHVGRHTFATLFLERGGSVEVLQKLLGHASIKTTMIYVHITDSRSRDQVFFAFDDFGDNPATDSRL